MNAQTASKTTQETNQGTIVVFRIQLLPPSETFIVAQAAAGGADRVRARDGE